ncbi:hypothetical protein MMC32_003010 [Xylographa parallela]|nr:hypothetical protein [Xylographa parallela]
MVVEDTQRVSSTESQRNQPPRHSNQQQQPIPASYAQQRRFSTSATPTQASTSGSSASSIRPTSQHSPSYPDSIASDRGKSHHRQNEARNGGVPGSNYQEIVDAQDYGSEDGHDRSDSPLSNAPHDRAKSPPSPRLLPTLRSSLSLTESGSGSPNRIKVRDLNHIQSFASEEVLTRSRHGSRHSLKGRQDGGQQYEISAMPVTDIIEMVSGLLTKITTTNDRQHEHMHRHIPPPEGTTGLSQQTTSVLAFHGKNVPSITILSYLSRIHKYCPTTYEVFLSLLVYFDRMTEMINSGTLSSFRYTDDPLESPNRPGSSAGHPRPEGPNARYGAPRPASAHQESMTDAEAYDLSHFFVVDSFNIHRLVIAGVTCASKFFSDVFYTNSRYAKVGGLPLIELNHLELQFLLLNDFRLSVPVEELEAYGSMLVEFYAKEVMAQQQSTHSVDALYMQSPRPTPA